MDRISRCFTFHSIAGLTFPYCRYGMMDIAARDVRFWRESAMADRLKCLVLSTALGVWGIASKHLAPAENVRSALLLVERGEVPAGIVYATDAAASSRVVVVGTFPPNSHDPINYPFAITRAGDTPEARSLLDFIAGPEGQTIFARFGFSTE
jgi:molybdenum ABC transporter molybdate-binding protein